MKRLHLFLFVVVLALVPALTSADPPPCNMEPTCVTGMFCIRITDIALDLTDAELDRYHLEFEILNWTDQELFGLTMAINAETSDFYPPADPLPFIHAATADSDGRPLGAGSDDSNFPPADGEAGAKTGQANSWTVATQTSSLVRFAEPTGTPGNGVDARDILGSGTYAAACALLPGCPLPSPEQPDNGAVGVDGGVDNVLDGFVLTIDDLDPGDVISLNWFLLDSSANPIGVSGTGNVFGFGTYNFFASDSTLPQAPPLWERAPGAPQGAGANIGTSSNSRDMFVSDDGSGQSFGVEAGGAMTGQFLVLADNIHGAPVNAVAYGTGSVGVPTLSEWAMIVLALLMLLVGARALRKRSRFGTEPR